MSGLDPTYAKENNVSINGHESSLISALYGVLQGSVLGSLLFLIYINDFNQTKKFCKVILLMTLICFTSINLLPSC